MRNFMSANRFAPEVRACAPLPEDPQPLYSVGDTVMHPSEGVCSVQELRAMQFNGMAKRMYYILKPATEKSSSTVYLPVARGNTILRRLLSEQDIRAIIRRSADCADLWIADSKQRKDAFNRILAEGDYAKIIHMTQEIRRENAQRVCEGKKACAADAAILDEAERLLHQEFSYVLRLSLEETAAFISRELAAC